MNSVMIKFEADIPLSIYGIVSKINKESKQRTKRYKYYANKDLVKLSNSDLVINSDYLGLGKMLKRSI